jgi:DNA-binding NarL/FixJ family response regulator
LIIINYFAVQRNMPRRRIVTAGEALAPRARGEEHGAPRPPGADICAVHGRGEWEKIQDVQSTQSYRLVIADDHPLFRGALRESISGLLEKVDIAEAGTFDDVVALLERGGDVDLVLLDLTMPGVRGFSGLMYMRAQYPSVPVIVVSANDDPAAIRRCMEFGASGFIPKTLGVDAMRAAISRILSGGVWTPPDVDLTAGSNAEAAELMARMATLTPQQVRVLMMLSEGLLNKQIAYQLSVSEATVKAHVSAILQKLGVESRTQAVIAAAKMETGQWSQGASAEG